MSGELKTRIEIGSLYIKPFKSLVLEDLYVEDLEGDTLLSSPRFTLDLNFLSLKLRKISVNSVQMDNGKFYLKQYRDSTTNIEFIVNYFNTGTPKPAKKVRRPYDITFDNIILNNIAFKYRNFNVDEGRKDVINFNDLSLTRLNAIIRDLDTKTHLARADIAKLTFHEKSGFYLKSLSTQATIDTNRMEFTNLKLETPTTVLSDYVLMTFNDFKDFPHFISKVYVKAHLNDSYLNPRDIAYFSPTIKPVNMTIRLKGDLSGYVNNIKARNFSLRTGKATSLAGNFDIKGLPNINETFMSLRFDQVTSNKADAEYIIKTFTGRTVLLPPAVQKLGNVNFEGHFTGFPQDFIAHGEFRTSLGRIASDINMTIKGETPAYTGTIKTYDFNIGQLLNREDLGRTTATASVKGSGFNLKQIKETVNGNITYLDYKGYRYSNIKVDGTFSSNLFNGKLSIDDKNIKLDFDGSVNLNTKTPEYRFTANIQSLNLHSLNFTKDTIQLQAELVTNFSGNSLDNIQGNLSLKNIHLSNSKSSLLVDSLLLAAEGTGNNRSLIVRSDILDASIHGQYDLQTLPGYFASVVKQYIPSLNLNNTATGVQNFDLKLTLKYFEPVSLLLIPELKIPEGAVINGKFVSAQNIATLNGSVKLIQYKGIKVHNVILDETNDARDLNVFLTADQINFTDSLYVKNINISNIIGRDSLALNIKLSDVDATNQLDLNGLIEFGRDTLIRLSLLPSDVVINHEAWRIQDQVRLKFDHGKTVVENFELFRDDQLLTINGIISTDPSDRINANFQQFKLTTFNSLTKSAGLVMKGEMNGNVSIANITRTPRIEAEIGIDSMMFNNTLIGDLRLNTDYDNATRLVNVRTNVLKQGKETLNIHGTYNANADQNSLDMTVTMNNSDVVIFQPLLKNLVSNLHGEASADLKLSGKLTKPRIDGSLTLNNTGMTVNYLRTPYTITDDRVSVENSVVKFNNLVIRDIRNHEAIADGTVDMANPLIPIIHVNIEANNFMVLNTTEKDNPLYYGIAYGTGEFMFNGPTNNMRIDIRASTEPGTVFNIPLNGSETIKDNDFITFVAKDTSVVKKRSSFLKGLTMNFYLNITQSAVVNIYTELGVLSGQGVADDLHLQISSLGDFNIDGNYYISNGSFTYIPNNFINRKFTISQGGSIHWSGAPTDATINLKAIYGVRTYLTNLYSAAGRVSSEANRTRVLAEVVMNLSGPLLSPGISFELNFPDNALVRDELQSYLSSQDNQVLQAISLIVRRTFAAGSSGDPSSQNIGQQSIETITGAGTELAFNQLNNIIAQSLNSNFLDLTIRSFNDVSATFNLLNKRLIITGGLTDQRTNLTDLSLINSSLSSVDHDIEAQYLLKRDGSLTLRGSNKRSTQSLLNQNREYVSALGLIYRQEFDNFPEFWRIITGQRRPEEKPNPDQKPAAPAPPPPPSSVPAVPVAPQGGTVTP